MSWRAVSAGPPSWCSLGGALGGLLGGALIAVFTRRRWLVLGPAAGVAVTFAAVVLVGAGVSRFDYGALQEPTFYAHGEELPRLLEFSERVLAAGEGYDDSYGEAVEGLTRLIAVAGERADEPAQLDRAVVVASDLHSNTLVLPSLEGFASGKPVFLVGDLTQRGTRYEMGIVPGIARLGAPVVAVSGNHDSRPLMLAAAERGVIVLTRSGRLLPDGTTDGNPVVSVAGLQVAGWDDPGESAAGTFEGKLLELKEQALVDAQGQFLAWFDALPERPDVVLVHRHGLAHALLSRLAAEGGEPVLVLTGHDHRPARRERGRPRPRRRRHGRRRGRVRRRGGAVRLRGRPPRRRRPGAGRRPGRGAAGLGRRERPPRRPRAAAARRGRSGRLSRQRPQEGAGVARNRERKARFPIA